MGRPSIYEYVGGEPAFLTLAAALHERCLADPELNHPFSHPGLRPDHTERLGLYLAEAFGGPPRYTQSYGGHSFMHGVHAGQGIYPELGRRFVECFVLAIDDAEFPDDAELRATMRSYMERAVAEVEGYAPPGSVVPADLAMPGWSWDGPIPA